MTYGGVFWYGLVVLALSFAAGVTAGNVIDGVIAAAANWLVFVLPVVVIRNIRRSKKAAKAAA